MEEAGGRKSVRRGDPLVNQVSPQGLKQGVRAAASISEDQGQQSCRVEIIRGNIASEKGDNIIEKKNERKEVGLPKNSGEIRVPRTE